MAKFIDKGETIEGVAISIQCRKWTHQGLKKHPIYKKTMALYLTDRNSVAEVLAVGETPNDSEIRQKTAHYHRNIGDILEADSIEVYIDKLSSIKPTVKEGASHRHGAQFVNTKCHTIATIRMPLETFKKKLGYTAQIPTKNGN